MAQQARTSIRTAPAEDKTVPRVQSPPPSREPRKGMATRERILGISERSVLAKGFAATSIEEIIAEAGITKSGFFYHFHDKNALARAMMRRSMAADEAVFDQVFGRGQDLSEDPLQAFLIGLKLLADMMADLPGGHPGCLIASICYQEHLFDRDLVALNRQWVESWRTRFLGHLRDIAAVHPPREPVRLEDLANMLTSVMEGGIIVGKVLKEPRELERQLLAYRTLVKHLFSPS